MNNLQIPNPFFPFAVGWLVGALASGDGGMLKQVTPIYLVFGFVAYGVTYAAWQIVPRVIERYSKR